jgi:hypothetical protein
MARHSTRFGNRIFAWLAPILAARYFSLIHGDDPHSSLWLCPPDVTAPGGAFLY